MLHVAFYSHDTFGLGHLRRSLKVASALAERLPSARGLLLTGSPWASRYSLPPRFRYVHLSPVVKTGPGEYRPRIASTSLDDVLTDRREVISRELAQFKPDLLVVDNVPCGLHGEILPALRFLAARGATRMVLSLRDVIDEDTVVQQQWKVAGAYEALERLYDEIWIFGPPDSPIVRALPPPVLKKAVICGRLGANGCAPPMPSPHDGSLERPGSPPAILVTGGGGGDARPLLETYLEAVRILRPRARHRLVLGPDYPAAHELGGSGADDLDMEIVEFEHNLPRAMLDADVVVAMGGYNTVAEALALGRRLVLVPRIWPRREQWLRACALAAAGRATVVAPDELTPERLWEAIETALRQPPPAPALPTGAQRATRRAIHLLSPQPMVTAP